MLHALSMIVYISSFLLISVYLLLFPFFIFYHSVTSYLSCLYYKCHITIIYTLIIQFLFNVITELFEICNITIFLMSSLIYGTFSLSLCFQVPSIMPHFVPYYPVIYNIIYAYILCIC